MKDTLLALLQRLVAMLPFTGAVRLYWRIRARRFGRLSVLNLGHGPGSFEEVTRSQRAVIFPLVSGALNGDERLCLDFGCGPGRFTADLADLIRGRAVGVDPIPELLALAPRTSSVEFKLMDGSKIPLSDGSVDLIWCCLVLGGIPDTAIRTTIAEFMRVLKRDGLMVLVENTSEFPSTHYWWYRSIETYRTLFPDIGLEHVHSYNDLDDTISIFIGRSARFER